MCGTAMGLTHRFPQIVEDISDNRDHLYLTTNSHETISPLYASLLRWRTGCDLIESGRGGG
jgi:hypothetical protein